MEHYLYLDYGYKSSYQEKLNLIKAQGFTGVFLFFNENTQNVIDLVKESKLKIETLHLPYTNCNELWINGSLGEEYIATAISGIRCAGKNNIKKVVFHITAKANPPAYNEIGLERIKKLLKVCAEEDVYLALENLRRLDYLNYIFDNISDKYLKFCFDSGHAHAFTQNIETFPFSKYQDKFICCHLHDNHGEHDEHLIPFLGNIDFKKLMYKFKKIDYQGPLTCEAIVKDETMEEIEALKAIKSALDVMDAYFKEG